MSLLRVLLGCLLLANCAVIHHAVVVPEDPTTLVLPLTIAGDVRICVQENPARWECLTADELRQVIATLKRL